MRSFSFVWTKTSCARRAGRALPSCVTDCDSKMPFVGSCSVHDYTFLPLSVKNPTWYNIEIKGSFVHVSKFFKFVDLIESSQL